MAGPELSNGSTEQLDYDAAVLNIQARAAESAANVGQFQSNFHQFAEDALDGRSTISFEPQPEDSVTVTETDGTFTVDTSASGIEGTNVTSTVDALADEQKAALRTAINRHDTQVVSAATDGIQNLGVQDMPEGQLGEANIGGSGRVSKEMLGRMRDAADAKQANHAGKHEQGHMESVQLKGDLVIDGEVEGARPLYESYAELTGNRGVGEGSHYFRDGQPADYKHAQEVGILLEDVVGRAAYEQTMTGDGEVVRLQRKLDEKGRGRTQRQIQDGVGEDVLAA